MARFGKLPVQIPAGVTIDITSEKVVVKGAKGEIERQIPQGVVVKKTDSVVLVEKLNNSKQAASTQGTIRSHVLNMIHGVTVGWKKDLEIVRAGFRAEVRGKDLVMNIGYSHPIVVPVPQGISLKVEKSIISRSSKWMARMFCSVWAARLERTLGNLFMISAKRWDAARTWRSCAGQRPAGSARSRRRKCRTLSTLTQSGRRAAAKR